MDRFRRMVYGYRMKITRQTLDPEAAPISMGDRIHFLPDGSLHLVLDDDIFDKHLTPDHST